MEFTTLSSTLFDNQTIIFDYSDTTNLSVTVTQGVAPVSYAGRNLSMILQIMYSVIGGIGIVGNGLVLFIIYRVPSLRNITNLFIFNQSLIDFVSSVMLCVCFLSPVVPLPSNPALATVICALWSSRYAYWGAHKASTTNLLILTLERYVAVVHPVQYRKQVRRRRAVVVAVMTWVIGYTFQLFWVAVQRGVNGACRIVWPNKAAQRAFGMLLFITQIIIPVTLMIFIYTSIYLVLTGRVNKVASTAEENPPIDANRLHPNEPQRGQQGGNYRVAASRNVLKTLIIICVIYVVCWTPNMTIFLYYSFGGKIDFSAWPYLSAVCMGFGNMIFNPFVYTFQYGKFKKAIRKVFGHEKRGGDDLNTNGRSGMSNT